MKTSKGCFILATLLGMFCLMLACGSCSDNSLNDAIAEGYDNAFKKALDERENPANPLAPLKLSDDDFNEIKALFDAEDEFCGEDSITKRIKRIEETLKENDWAGETNVSFDRSQWGGVNRAANNGPVVYDVYLDNSDGMKGFIEGASSSAPAFPHAVSAVDNYAHRWVNREGKTPTINAFYTQHDKTKKADEIVGRPWGDFKSEVTNRRLRTFTDSYNLSRFMGHIARTITNDAANRRLCFFFTDAMPSGTNRQLRENTRYNLEHDMDLKNDIRDSLYVLKGRAAVSIYQFKGRFVGEYIDCTNGRHKGVDELRPFFVIVMGAPDLVSDFKEEVSQGLEGFKPQNEVHFIAAPSGLALLPVDFTLRDDNKLLIDPSRITEDKDGFPKVDNFELRIARATIPSYLCDEATLRQTATFKLEDKVLDQITLEKDAVTLKVGTVRNEDCLHITIKNTLPMWIETNENRDDTKSREGTFYLSVLVNAVREALFDNETIAVQEEYDLMLYEDND